MFRLIPLLMLLALPARAAEPAPRLRCDLTYAGATQRIEAGPTTDPYAVPSVDVGGRFWFKPVLVQGGGRVERIGLYAYVDTEAQPVLIQHARYLPPFPRGRAGQPVDLTGVQHLYAGPLERELIYQCWLLQGRR